jgi:hypothetical protein
MKPKILIMGREQNYCEAEVSRARLEKEIPKIIGTLKEEELLYSLRIENTEIPANQLRNYGSTTPLTEGIGARETIIDGLERLFKRVEGYAKNYGAPYVLVQDLKLKQLHQTFDIYGLAQLLIE